VPRPVRTHSVPPLNSPVPSRRMSEPSLPYLTIPSFILRPPPSSEWTTIFANACLLPPTASVSETQTLFPTTHVTSSIPASEAFCPQTSTEVRSSRSAFIKSVLKETLAPFAAEVYLGNEEKTANSFVWNLKESFLGMFRATWHASVCRSIASLYLVTKAQTFSINPEKHQSRCHTALHLPSYSIFEPT
jgi:hypothetical protein